MENDIALMAAGYVAARLGLVAIFGYVIYRVLKASQAAVPVRVHSRYARERVRVTQHQR